MEKKIVRTFKSYEVIIVDAIKVKRSEEGKILEGILKTEIIFTKPNKTKIASNFVKETGNTCFIVEIKEMQEQREISYEDFIKYSKVVENKNESEEV